MDGKEAHELLVEAFDDHCAKLEERLYGLNGDLYEHMAAFVRAKGLGGA